MKLIMLSLLLGVLVACGGSSDPVATDPTVIAAVKPKVGVPAFPPRCTPKVVTVQLVGDSTQFGVDGATYTIGYLRATEPPDVVLQQILDARFGAGSTIVTNSGVSGSSTQWPPGILAVNADVTVVNFGINDSYTVPIEAYKSTLRILYPTIYETPNPVDRDFAPLAGVEAYAQAMRDVAAEMHVPVADVMAYALVHDWRSKEPDLIHPSNAFYREIVTNVLAPVVIQQVANKLHC
jgi:lysophospholipase L1-like esterase